MKIVLIIVSTIFFYSYLNSQQISADSLMTYSMKEFVVTATRSEKNIKDIGKSVSIITREQLNDSFMKSLSGSLSSKNSIFVVGEGQNYGMNQSIFMRGANSNQTVIMIDNVRITDPSSVNNTPDLSELSTSNIERVEIVSGLNSSLYGSSAIGGVVNLLSRKKQDAGLNVDLNFGAGTFGKSTSSLNQDLFINYTFSEGFYINTELNNLSVKGIDATDDTVLSLTDFKNRDRDGFRHRDFTGMVGYVDDMLDIYASYKNTDQKKDLDKRAYIDDDNYSLDYYRNIFTYGLSYRMIKELDLRFVGGYTDMKRTAIDDSSKIDWFGNYDHSYNDERYRGSVSSNEIQANYKSSEFELLLGGSLYNENMSSRQYIYLNGSWGPYESLTDLDTLDLDASTASIYSHSMVNGSLISDELGLLSLSFGWRILKHSSFGTEFVYELNPSIKLTPFTLLYGSYGTGFNSPSLYQLYSPNIDYTSGITRGNKNIFPEYTTSFEIGLKHSILDLEFGISYFESKTKNVIEYVYLWDKNVGLDTLGNDWSRNDYRGDTYLNLGDQSIKGIELSVKQQISDEIFIDGNVSIVDGKIKYNPNVVDQSVTQGNHVQIFGTGAFMNKESEYIGLVRRPSSANIRLSYLPIKELFLDINLKYIGRRGDVYYDSNLGPYGALGTIPVEDYSIVDFYAKYLFSPNVNAGLKIENLFNTKYREIKGYSTRGRGLYLNLNLSI
ncbi:MAG: TonB-dependent receptor [Ignavibacteriales bacterium]|nr:TonB-dependent receptor [Ignavibacteriales bacterium]